MADKPYSNRELDSKFTTLIEKCDMIIVQTTKHNGRLSKVERWMWVMIGGITVITTLVLPLLFFYISAVDARIQKIENIFANYNIEIIE